MDPGVEGDAADRVRVLARARRSVEGHETPRQTSEKKHRGSGQILSFKSYDLGKGDGKGRDKMDPITLIIAALAAGASTGAIDSLKDDAKEAAKTAYGKLRALVQRRFSGNARAENALADHQDEPETYEKPLAKQLTDSGAAKDEELLKAAQAVMDLVDPKGAETGKYSVKISGSKGVQVGDHNTQTNTFN
jgi:hypothetical protein